MNIKNRLDLHLFAIVVLIITLVTASSAIAGETRVIEKNETVSGIIGTNDPDKIALFMELNRQAGGDEIQNAGDLIIEGNDIYVPTEAELDGMAWEMNDKNLLAADAIHAPVTEDNPNFIGPSRPPEDPENTDDTQNSDDTDQNTEEEDEEDITATATDGDDTTISFLNEPSAPAERDEDNSGSDNDKPMVGRITAEIFEDNCTNLAKSEMSMPANKDIVAPNEDRFFTDGWYQWAKGLWK